MIKEIIYVKDRNNPSQVPEYFQSEVEEMRKLGIRVGTTPSSDSEQLFYRGFIMHSEEQYPTDKRFIQGWKEYDAILSMSKNYDLIKDISIPTFFVDKLDKSVEEKIISRGWDKAFIKNEKKSLWDEGELASVWPINSIEELRCKYENLPYKGVYAVRKFINPEIFPSDRLILFTPSKSGYSQEHAKDVTITTSSRSEKLFARFEITLSAHRGSTYLYKTGFSINQLQIIFF